MRWIRRLPWGPGAVVALVLWLWTLGRVDYATDAQENIDLLWQSLGSEILSADPLGSLMALHIQPPLLNALFGLDVMITPESHLLLLLLNVGAMVATIALMVDALVRLGVPRWVGSLAGVAYALLPGTIAYSLWVYNVTIVGFLAMAAVWGVSLMRSRPSWGAMVSALAMLGLVLTRSTFAFPILVLWVIALMVLARQRVTRHLFVALGVVVLAGTAVQAHYFVNFGLVTMSSWSGQNILNATRTSGVLNVTEGARESVFKDACAGAALSAFEEERLNLWDPGGLFLLPECSGVSVRGERGAAAWDTQFKPGSQELNFNWRYGLAASGVWTGIALDVVRGDPLQLVQMAIVPPAGVQASGVARYLSRSENYPWVVKAAESLPLTSAGSTYSTVFAPLAWLVVVLGWVGAAASRRWRRQTHPAFWFGSALLVFHLLASTLLEYAEAMRFRAEVEPVLMFVTVGAVWSGFQWWRQRVRRVIAADTSPSSAVR